MNADATLKMPLDTHAPSTASARPIAASTTYNTLNRRFFPRLDSSLFFVIYLTTYEFLSASSIFPFASCFEYQSFFEKERRFTRSSLF